MTAMMQISNKKAREIAGECVDPVFADDSKIALFAATGEIEAGLSAAVGEALDYAREHSDESDTLAGEVGPLEEFWAYLETLNTH
jgi:hypothetical protein